jgi:hypothetical protein
MLLKQPAVFPSALSVDMWTCPINIGSPKTRDRISETSVVQPTSAPTNRIHTSIGHMFTRFGCTCTSSTHTLLTPWCRTLFEKLIVTQLVRKILLSSWNLKVHYRVHKSPPMDPILSQPYPVRTIDPYLPKVQLNVIHPFTPRFSQWSLTVIMLNSCLRSYTCTVKLQLLHCWKYSEVR